eukprot:gene14744-14913_t
MAGAAVLTSTCGLKALQHLISTAEASFVSLDCPHNPLECSAAVPSHLQLLLGAFHGPPDGHGGPGFSGSPGPPEPHHLGLRPPPGFHDAPPGPGYREPGRPGDWEDMHYPPAGSADLDRDPRGPPFLAARQPPPPRQQQQQQPLPPPLASQQGQLLVPVPGSGPLPGPLVVAAPQPRTASGPRPMVAQHQHQQQVLQQAAGGTVVVARPPAGVVMLQGPPGPQPGSPWRHDEGHKPGGRSGGPGGRDGQQQQQQYSRLKDSGVGKGQQRRQELGRTASAPAEVLSVTAERGMGLFTEHVALCLYRLGQLRQAGAAVDGSSQQLQDLVGLCRSRCTSMGPKQLAEVAWALAQIQLVPDVSFLDSLASQCLAKLSGFTAEQLATTMWSFASLGYIPGTPLLEAAAGMLLQNLALFTPKFTANAMWGFARMEYRPPNGLLDAVLKLLAESLTSFAGDQLSQLLWAYSQFGHPLPPQLLSAVLQHTETSMATLQPDALSTLLLALRALGAQLGTGLLSATAEVAVANMGSFSSYAMLAYAPPKALLQQLRQQLQPQLGQVDPSQLCAALWCFSLFKDLTPELWNGAMAVLSQPAVAASIQPAALNQLYQAYVLVIKAPEGAGRHVIPPQLILTAWQPYKATNDAAVAAPPTDLLQDVARCLAAIGIPYAMKIISEDGLLALGLALPDRRVAIEVFDASCFCGNQQQPLGETVMRIQLLGACGWQPVTVPFYDWLPLGSELMKQNYLRSMMGLPAVGMATS